MSHASNFDTLVLHGDSGVVPMPSGDVAPPLHVSTTYLMSNKEGFLYARDDTPTRKRLEAIIGKIEHGVAVTYGSGLAAIYAALTFLRPTRILKDKCYHGTNRIVDQFFVPNGVPCLPLTADIQSGDVVVLETPSNPRGRCYDIQSFASKCRLAGAKLLVDSTFASPVLQLPLLLGADLCVHSATKFLSGHSDVLAGVVIAPTAEIADKLKAERSVSGGTLGNMEAWLLLRSIRTLGLRVKRQSETACKVAAWLATQGPLVTRVWHTSRPDHPDHQLALQQMSGHPGVLAIDLATPEQARQLVTLTRVFADCTSLGGVESLIDYRQRWDSTEDPCIVRLSIGLESPEDLIADLAQAFAKLNQNSTSKL